VSKRVARLVVTLSAHAPADAIVKIDGEPLQPNVVGTPIVLDPGPHEIAATGSGTTPFHARLTLAEGAQSGIEATLVVAHPFESPPAVLEPRARAAARDTQPQPPQDAPGSSPRATGATRATAGIILLASGGALLAGATAILLVRNADIQSIEAACPGGICPTSQASQLESTHDRAVIEGPAGVTVGVAGIAAAGVGIYFLATRRSPAIALAPWIDRAAAGLSWTGGF
jgi:hypothetical protein